METVNYKFSRGDEVKDLVTGLKGIVVGQTMFLTGCARYMVQSQTLKDGKSQDLEHFDENQLELVKARKVKIPGWSATKKEDSPGGPRPAPRGMPHARR
jgi:hypothetical protein